MPGRRFSLLAALVLLSSVVLVACSDDNDVAAPDGAVDGVRLVVASTFPVISEFAERVGGDRVEVINLIPLGVDEHAYHPPTTLPREIVRADLVLVNGYYLEESMLGIVVENVRSGVPVVSASRGLTLLEGGHVHEFVEGVADQAAVDAAVADIGRLVEAALRGDAGAVETVDAIDVIVHALPSRSRTEALRAIDRFIHDVPRGQITAEEALHGIANITRSYEPAPGPEVALAHMDSIVSQAEGNEVDAAEALSRIDHLLDQLALDERNEQVRDIDAVVAEWVDGATDAAQALLAVRAVLDGSPSVPTRTGNDDLVDDLVFATGDPHLWLDARNMAVYVENIRDALTRADPEGAAEYAARAADVVQELEALHEELLATLAEIPVERRQLVVFHDAFQYFAAAYDFEVIASVAPANPNQARSAAVIAQIIGQVRNSGVPTIYREPQYSSQSLDLIAADSGTMVSIIHSIPSQDVPTYAEMMRANARSLVEGLAGGG